LKCPTNYKSGHSTNSYSKVKDSLVEREYNEIKENLPEVEVEISQGQKIIDLLNKTKNTSKTVPDKSNDVRDRDTIYNFEL